MAKDFAHLHVHTEYSLLDGYSNINTLVQHAKEQHMHHLAITDHGAMYGVIEFYKACKATGVHPVIGCEAYLTEDRHNRQRQRGQKEYSHLLLLARNQTGYHNLMQLTTIAHTEGYYSKPRIDKHVLAQYAEGLIVTSSCLGGEIPQLLLSGREDEARKAIRWYQEVFGPEHFYLEVQEHHGCEQDGTPSPLQPRLNHMLYDLHKALHIPMVATNDLHYVHAEDAHAHELLLCVQTRDTLSNPKRFHFDSHEYYLRSPEEMARIFPDLPDALRNSIVIAEQCEVDPFARKASLPAYTIPPGYASQEQYLLHLCEEGLRQRYSDVTDAMRQRLQYEFQIIADKGFVPYFLIVWDYVNYARSHGIRCSARGSAAGSVLAYVLGITNVDPLRYGLLFERFMNPERMDMPDIDMDFQDDRRDEVIEYVMRKYGAECVAQMATFMTMGVRQSVRDVGRALELPVANRLAPLMKKPTLDECLQTDEVQQLLHAEKQAEDIIDEARHLINVVRGVGVHAAGVIIANEAIDRFVPMQLRDNNDVCKGRISQYEQKHLEELGLIKFDFLGLSNLTILDRTITYIKATRGEEIVLEEIPLDVVPGDKAHNQKRKKAFDLLAAGETTGVFQLESPKMREYITQLKPTCIEDITAMCALYRPGPMDSIPDFISAKHGRKQVEYLDPRLAEWLEESYGVIVYQDQVLLIAVHLAGFSWGKVNKFRKALGKKIMHEVEGYRGDFIEGCVNNGVAPDVAERLFELIQPFGGYGFNKAHAASYAVIAFYCAYLKANYPAEFMAALMTAEASKPDKIADALAECRRLGVEVLKPDINKSRKAFSVESGNVRFGLLAIKGIGDNPIDAILEARRAGGAFTDLADFCTRVSPAQAGKSAIETLIKVGAMDALTDGGKMRHTLLASIDPALRFGKGERAARNAGMQSLFGEEESAIRFELVQGIAMTNRSQAAAWEKELLGVALSTQLKMPVREVAPPRVHYLVWITIQRTDDDAHDLERIRALSALLQEQPGEDTYELVLSAEEWSVRLAPDLPGIAYSAQLHAHLEQLLGRDAVRVQEFKKSA